MVAAVGGVHCTHCACAVAVYALTLDAYLNSQSHQCYCYHTCTHKTELKVQLTPRYRQLAHEMKCTEVLLHLAQDAFEAQEGVAYEQVLLSHKTTLHNSKGSVVPCSVVKTSHPLLILVIPTCPTSGLHLRRCSEL
jgi:hypothetical protein